MKKIGIVTTGHGPRDEYIHYHGAVLAALGAEVEIVTRHALEGLGFADLRAHFVDHSVPNIGAHVHQAGATGNQYGPGWSHPMLALDFMVGRMADAVQRLERKDRVDIVLLACAADLPVDAIRGDGLLVHPRDLMFDLAGHLAKWTRRRLKVGAMVSLDHAEADHADWAAQSFFTAIDFHLATVSGDIEKAAAELGAKQPDVAFYFGYGIGLAPFVDPQRTARIEASLKAPLVLPHRIASLFMRNLVAPGMQDASFMPTGWWRKP